MFKMNEFAIAELFTQLGIFSGMMWCGYRFSKKQVYWVISLDQFIGGTNLSVVTTYFAGLVCNC